MLKKLKEKAKKVLVAVLSLTTAGSGLAAAAMQTVSAASEWNLTFDDKIQMPFEWDGAGTRISQPGGISLFRLTNKTTGEALQVFCIQKGIDTNANTGYGGAESSTYWNSLSATTQRNISVAAKYYYQYHYDDTNYRVALQTYIWNVTLKNLRDNSGDLNWSVMLDTDKSGRGAAIKAAYDEYVQYVANYDTRPSLDNSNISLNPGESVTVHDTNKVLHLDEWQIDKTGVPAGVSITKNGDDITVTIDASFTGKWSGKLNIRRFMDLTVNDNRFLVFSSEETYTDNGGQTVHKQELVYPHGLLDDPNIPFNVTVTTGRITVYKYDNVSFAALPGTVFEVRRKADDSLVTTLTTDEMGEARTVYLPYGEYYVIETKASKGYNITDKEKHYVTINKENTEVEFYDKIIQGSVAITKVDKEHPEQKLSGVKFDIYKVKGIGDATMNIKVGSMTTNKDGYALSGLLDYGEYYLMETESQYGYFNDQTKYYFTIDKEQTTIPLTIENTQIKSQIIVTKEDSNKDGYGIDKDGKVLTLAGAEFELWQHVVIQDVIGNTIQELEVKIAGPRVTDENGKATFNEQIAISAELQQTGSYYYIKEVKAPFGYKLNNEEHKVEYNYEGQFVATVKMETTFANDIMTGKIKVIKVDLEDHEVKVAGAKFNIINSLGKVVDTVTTDANGEATSKALRLGDYTLVEIESPKGYQLDPTPHAISIKAEEQNDGNVIVLPAEITLENERDKGFLEITKVDGLTVDYKEVCENDEDPTTCTIVAELTDETVFLPNVDFVIYKQDDLTKVVARGTTDSEGKLKLKLDMGKYYFQEVKTVPGYNVNPKLVGFELTYNGQVVEELVANMEMYGQIKVRKIGEKLVGTEVKEDGTTGLIFEETFMAGTKFELYADEDILHPITGKVVYEKDSVVREIITGEDGDTVVENLPLGRYYVKEIAAPAEHSIYELSSDVKYIELSEEDANFEGVVEAEATFVNERVIIDPSIYKVGAKAINPNNLEEGYEYTPLAGAKFGIYNSEVITSDEVCEDEEEVSEGESACERAVELEAGTLLAVMTTDEEGRADVQVKLPFGKYYLQEISAPEGYYLDENQYEFELVWEQEMQESRVLNIELANEENPLVNYWIEVPQTSDNTVIYIVAGTAVLAASGLAILFARKRKLA